MKGRFLATLAIVGSLTFIPAMPALAINIVPETPGVNNQGNKQLGERIAAFIKLMLYFIGAVSVMAIIYGGIRFVMAAGDASAVKTAREIIFYACIGLIVALLSAAIVDFVINAVT